MRRKLSDDYFDPSAPRGQPTRYIHEGCSKRGDKTLVITLVQDGWVYDCHRCGLRGFRDLNGMGGSVVARFARAIFNPVPLVVEQLTLPERHQDPDPALVNKADTWLMSFGITEEEKKNAIKCYVDNSTRLVFPVYNNADELIYWQSRGFRQNEPKWMNQRAAGKENVYFEVVCSSGSVPSGVVTLVEDIISAVKVGRVCPAIALLGSYIPDKLIWDLTTRFKRIIIWLDFDKRAYTIKRVKRFQEFGLPVLSVFTKDDPKKQTMEVIRSCVY